MNAGAKTRLLSLALVLSLVITLTILLTRVFGDFAREVLAVPFWYTLWLGGLVFRSLPQPLVWALFLTLALLLAAGSMVRHEKIAQAADEVAEAHRGRVQVLRRYIQLAAEGDYFKHRLAQHLGELILEVLAHHERTTIGQMRQRLRAGRLDVPPEIQAYLQEGLKAMSPRPGGFLSRLRWRLRLSTRESPLDLDPERVVQFLEDQLEIKNDDGNS